MILCQLSADADPTLLAGELLKAISGGHWALVAVLAVVGLTIAARRIGGRYWPVLATQRAAWAIALVGSVGGAVATALLAGEALSVALVAKAAMVALVALLPSAAAKAEAKGQEAAGQVVGLSDALAELNKKP